MPPKVRQHVVRIGPKLGSWSTGCGPCSQHTAQNRKNVSATGIVSLAEPFGSNNSKVLEPCFTGRPTPPVPRDPHHHLREHPACQPPHYSFAFPVLRQHLDAYSWHLRPAPPSIDAPASSAALPTPASDARLPFPHPTAHPATRCQTMGQGAQTP